MRSHWVGLTCLALGGTLLAAQKPPDPPLNAVLGAAAAYVGAYEKQFGAVAADEKYQQDAAISAGGRLLRAEIALLSGGSAGWLTYRDVFEVNGAAVHARDGRVVTALQGPAANALETARRISADSARHLNFGVNRGVSTPTLALQFLRADSQSRSTFTLDSFKTVDKVRAAVVQFTETGSPRMLRTADDAAAEGKLWIDPATGRVLQSELRFKTGGVAAKIAVHYADHPALGFWVPVRADEEYDFGTVTKQGMTLGQPTGPTVGRGAVTGRADYSNFRRINVDLAAIVR